jgi:hypothetical protein
MEFLILFCLAVVPFLHWVVMAADNIRQRNGVALTWSGVELAVSVAVAIAVGTNLSVVLGLTPLFVAIVHANFMLLWEGWKKVTTWFKNGQPKSKG